MQVSVKTTSGLERQVKVAVPAESVEAQVDVRIKATAGDVRLPGFRPGKVPLKEVRRRFGPEVRRQVVADVLQSSFADVVRQERLALASQASIILDNTDPGGDLEYTATFEVLPTFQLTDLTTLRIGKPEAEITEKDIDETVEVMRAQRRTWRPVERAAREGDQVTVDYSVKVAGKVVRGPTEQAMVVGDEDNLDEVNGALVGVVANEHRVFPTTLLKSELDDAKDEGEALGEDESEALSEGEGEASEDVGDNPQAATPTADSDALSGTGDGGEDANDGDEDADPAVPEALPDAIDETVADQLSAAEIESFGDVESLDDPGDSVPAIAEIAVHSVEEGILPDLDDDFFDLFNVDSEGDRHAKFREQVRERMQVELDGATRQAMRRQVLNALAQAHDFELPQAMVAAELQNQLGRMKRLLRGNVDEALFAEAFRPNAEQDVRSSLTLSAVIDHADIQPHDQQVRARIEEIASAYEEAAEVRRWLYGNEEQLRRVEATVAEQQAVEYVLSQANAVPIPLSYQDVVKGLIPDLQEEDMQEQQADASAQPADAPEYDLLAPPAPQPDGDAEPNDAEDGEPAGEIAVPDEPPRTDKASGGWLRRFFGARKD